MLYLPKRIRRERLYLALKEKETLKHARNQLDPAWVAQSDLTNQRLVYRSRDLCGPIGSLTYLTRPDLVLGEAEAPNEFLDLDTLHLLPNLLGHSHTLKYTNQKTSLHKLTNQKTSLHILTNQSTNKYVQ